MQRDNEFSLSKRCQNNKRIYAINEIRVLCQADVKLIVHNWTYQKEKLNSSVINKMNLKLAWLFMPWILGKLSQQGCFGLNLRTCTMTFPCIEGRRDCIIPCWEGQSFSEKMFRIRRFMDCYWLCVCLQPVTKHTLHSLLSEVMDQSLAPPGSGPEPVANKYYKRPINFFPGS